MPVTDRAPAASRHIREGGRPGNGSRWPSRRPGPLPTRDRGVGPGTRPPRSAPHRAAGWAARTPYSTLTVTRSAAPRQAVTTNTWHCLPGLLRRDSDGDRVAADRDGPAGLVRGGADRRHGVVAAAGVDGGAIGGDRDGTVQPLDHLARRVGGGVDRGQAGLAGGVGGLAVGGDRDTGGEEPKGDRLAGLAGGGLDWHHPDRAGPDDGGDDDVGGFPVRRDRDLAGRTRCRVRNRDRFAGFAGGGVDWGYRAGALVADVGRGAVGGDRDGSGILPDLDSRAGLAGGGADRGHRAGAAVGDVGGGAVRGDRDGVWPPADPDRRERRAGGGADRGHRVPADGTAAEVNDVRGLAVGGDRDGLGPLTNRDRLAGSVGGGANRSHGPCSGRAW